MIGIDRSRVKEPHLLRTQGREALEKLRRHYRKGEAYRSRNRYPFRAGIWSHPQVLRALHKVFHGKCAYCESKIDGAIGPGAPDPNASAPSDVDHFRPKANALAARGRSHSDHYWWLAYDWDNLHLACRACNRHKRNLFPIEGKRSDIETPAEALRAERAELLDPCLEDPEPLFCYARDGSISGRDLRAQSTIEIVGLNRPELVERRRAAIEALAEALRPVFRSGPVHVAKQLPAVVRRQARAATEFAGLERWVLRRLFQGATAGASPWLKTFLRQILPPDLPRRRRDTLRARAWEVVREMQPGVEEPAAAAPRRKVSRHKLHQRRKDLRELRSWWIESVELENFMGIRELTVSFPPLTSDRDPWLMLLGANGVGKSAILKAIALSMISHQLRSELVPDASKLMNHDAPGTRGHVAVRLNSGDTIELRFSRNARKFRRTGRLPPLQVLGYGSTRRPPKPGAKTPRKKVLVQNLFDPLVSIDDPEKWLTDPGQLNFRCFNKLRPRLEKLLMLPEDARLSRLNHRLYVHQHGGRTSLREWSDGYQTVVALVLDITRKLSASHRGLDDVEGTVLLDEIEVHLHPQWKIRIVSLLRDLFPRVRFVVTTHDPLCLRGLERGEVCLLDRHPETGRVRIQALDVPQGLRADQLLTGEWFGLGSTLDQGTLDLLDEHRWLLLRYPKTAEELERQEEIEAELSERFSGFAETTPERIALATAARFMPEKARELSPKEGRDLRAKILAALRSEAA